ncbi:MAG TPA: FG-GAP repeat protein, partial [Pirellulales bacterium]
MNWRLWSFLAAVLAALGLSTVSATDKPAPKITWKKIVVDRAFRSEGVAVADVNKDGKPDILVGNFWYEA